MDRAPTFEEFVQDRMGPTLDADEDYFCCRLCKDRFRHHSVEQMVTHGRCCIPLLVEYFKLLIFYKNVTDKDILERIK